MIETLAPLLKDEPNVLGRANKSLVNSVHDSQRYRYNNQ